MPLSLPPPVQTPKRQGNNSEDLEHFENSRENIVIQNIVRQDDRENETVTPAQEKPVSFENILKNRWTRWRVFSTYTCSKGKTEIAGRNQTKTLHQLPKDREYK